MLSRSAMSGDSSMIGAILAGGASTRMGRDKGLVEVNGKPMVQSVIDALLPVVERVVLVGDRASSYAFTGLPVIPDRRPGCGPLGGLHAALLEAGSGRVLALPCDMPFLSTAFLEYLADYPSDTLAHVVSFAGQLHPLCGVYDASALPVVERHLGLGRFAMHDLLTALGAHVVPITPELPFYTTHLLANVNDMATLASLLPERP